MKKINLQPVKIDKSNRVKLCCFYCSTVKNESEMFADLDSLFKYICKECVKILEENYDHDD